MRFVKLTANVPVTAGGSKVVRVNLEFVQSIAELPGGSEITFSNGKTLVLTERAEAIIGKQGDEPEVMSQEEIERIKKITKELGKSGHETS